MGKLQTMLATQVPLIEARTAHALLGQFLQPATAEPDSWRKARAALAPRTSVENGVGTLEIHGVLAYRPDIGDMLFDGFEDSAEVLAAFRHLEADPDVKSILLDVNSPGGFSVGGAEIADAVFKSAKPTVAWVGGMMCSLAYWIGSQADAVIATRSAMVGSIGAYVSVIDYHRMLANAGIEVKVFRNQEGTFKAAGMPGAPITDDHAAEFTRQAQRSFDVFKTDVLRSRKDVRPEAMMGQSFDGFQARSESLIDALGGLEYAFSVARRFTRSNPKMGHSRQK